MDTHNIFADEYNSILSPSYSNEDNGDVYDLLIR